MRLLLGWKMPRKKVIFVALLFFPCVCMFGFFIMNYDSDLCYYCFQKTENYFSIKTDYKRNLFIKVPESKCKQNPPFLVLLVTTTHNQKEARMAIRKTWGKDQLIQGKRVATFFLLGTNAGKPVSLSEEINTYKDIIQKDFVDTYYNLTIKTLTGLDWIVHHCPQTRYIMKTDTDMFVNTLYLIELLMRKNQTSNLFTGILKPNDPPIRNIFSKWYISKREYDRDKYPPFCSGTGYVLSVDVAQRIYNISFSIPFFKLEDVYIGMCLDKLKVPLQELHSLPIFFAYKPSFSVCTYRNLVTSHEVQPQEIIMYWEALQIAQEENC
ncbi:PREDICTED: beta-1,3-galactosyltransferase 5-like [Nanorana parkeri]|uniref:beta-1,3-galactosyltransferase 5-like n=1 Tax=Nanorana parkeri TaxID=125878 RepID=UPI00085499CD|nr:PREDICTED: beta-1,3-galactosyltransferase 5-like [Nanorana parkeri]